MSGIYWPNSSIARSASCTGLNSTRLQNSKPRDGYGAAIHRRMNAPAPPLALPPRPRAIPARVARLQTDPGRIGSARPGAPSRRRRRPPPRIATRVAAAVGFGAPGLPRRSGRRGSTTDSAASPPTRMPAFRRWWTPLWHQTPPDGATQGHGRTLRSIMGVRAVTLQRIWASRA